MYQLHVDMGGSLALPLKIEVAEKAMFAGVCEEMARAFGEASQSSQIAAATRVVGSGGDIASIEVGAGVPFTRIRDRGGTIVPRTAQILRFADGEFRPVARQEGIHYIATALGQWGPIVQRQYHAFFGTL